MSSVAERPSDCSKPRLVYVVTSSMTADLLLRGQLKFMKELGWHVTLISAPGEQLAEVAKRESVDVVTVPMERQPSLVKDFVSLVRLIAALKRLRPDVINYGTPKAGLLAAIASWLVRTPVRLYLLRGLRCEGASGVSRFVYLTTEKISSYCSTSVLCVSPSLRKMALKLKAIKSDKSIVIGSGSSNGIDCERFQVTDATTANGKNLRLRVGIPDDAMVVGFVGRLVADKGVPELVQAFKQVAIQVPRCHLLLVGPQEKGDPIGQQVRDDIDSSPQIHWLGPTSDTVTVYAAVDIVALPTHREGFPNVALEAAAMERPVISTTATGAIDAIVPNVTGLAVQAGDTSAIVDALTTYLGDEELRISHGKAGRHWVESKFRSQHVWSLLEQHYRTTLKTAVTKEISS